MNSNCKKAALQAALLQQQIQDKALVVDKAFVIVDHGSIDDEYQPSEDEAMYLSYCSMYLKRLR